MRVKPLIPHTQNHKTCADGHRIHTVHVHTTKIKYVNDIAFAEVIAI